MSEQRAHRSASCWCGHDGSAHFHVQGVFACRQCTRPQIEETPMLVTERRRFDRFALPHPLRTSVGEAPAYVVDASISGIGVLQHTDAPPVGSTCRLMFHSDFGQITLECQVARTAADGETFQTGLRIVAADAQSEGRLRMLVMTLAVPSTKRSGH